jgi:hypothetical protein
LTKFARRVSQTFVIASSGSARNNPRIPNRMPMTSWNASTRAGARSTVRRAISGTTMLPSTFWTRK